VVLTPTCMKLTTLKIKVFVISFCGIDINTDKSTLFSVKVLLIVYKNNVFINLFFILS